jgi:hypothetical protein
MFWDAVFSTFKPDMSVKFVTRGGKPILESLANDIISKDIKDTYVAMDADYDEYLGDKVVDRRVLYTYGYSIENDLFVIDNLYRTYAALTHARSISAAAKARLKSETQRILSELRLGVYSDVLALKAKTSVLPRESPGRIIGCDPATLCPFVRRSELKNLCGAANERSKPRQNVRLTGKMEVSKFCVGHVLRFALSQVIKATLRAFNRRPNLSSDHIRDMALQTFSQTLRGRNVVAKHHKQQMAAI